MDAAIERIRTAQAAGLLRTAVETAFDPAAQPAVLERLDQLLSGALRPKLDWASFEKSLIYGAYVAASGQILISSSLEGQNSKDLAEAVALEEIGHWLDNASGVDSRGDEGERFRKILVDSLNDSEKGREAGKLQIDGVVVNAEFYSVERGTIVKIPEGSQGVDLGIVNAKYKANNTTTFHAKITVLPSTTLGVLVRANGAAISTYEVMTTAELSACKFNSVADANGTTYLKYLVSPDTTFDNSDLPEEYEIVITGVNTAPRSTGPAITPILINEDAGLVSLGLANIAYDAGANETDQTLSYRVSKLPDINIGKVVMADGTTIVKADTTYTLDEIKGFKFQTTKDGAGSTSFEFKVIDNGSTNDVSDPKALLQVVQINVEAVNDNPVLFSAPIIALEDTFEFKLLSEGYRINAGGGVAEANQLLSFTVTSLPPETLGVAQIKSTGERIEVGKRYSQQQIEQIVFYTIPNAHGLGLIELTVEDNGSKTVKAIVFDNIARLRENIQREIRYVVDFDENSKIGTKIVDQASSRLLEQTPNTPAAKWGYSAYKTDAGILLSKSKLPSTSNTSLASLTAQTEADYLIDPNWMLLAKDAKTAFALGTGESIVGTTAKQWNSAAMQWEVSVAVKKVEDSSTSLRNVVFNLQGNMLREENIVFAGKEFEYEIQYNCDLNGDAKVGGSIATLNYNPQAQSEKKGIHSRNSTTNQLYAVNLDSSNTKGLVVSSYQFENISAFPDFSQSIAGQNHRLLRKTDGSIFEVPQGFSVTDVKVLNDNKVQVIASDATTTIRHTFSSDSTRLIGSETLTTAELFNSEVFYGDDFNKDTKIGTTITQLTRDKELLNSPEGTSNPRNLYESPIGLIVANGILSSGQDLEFKLRDGYSFNNGSWQYSLGNDYTLLTNTDGSKYSLLLAETIVDSRSVYKNGNWQFQLIAKTQPTNAATDSTVQLYSFNQAGNFIASQQLLPLELFNQEVYLNQDLSGNGIVGANVTQQLLPNANLLTSNLPGNPRFVAKTDLGFVVT
ncbi:hypothetical protein, partial [Synechococcus sp. UW140]|uniref:hypothetical protein n=1 Tax=Synechococcus sp. UW140 TaxID=368503 RepID=UPI0025CE8C43